MSEQHFPEVFQAIEKWSWNIVSDAVYVLENLLIFICAALCDDDQSKPLATASIWQVGDLFWIRPDRKGVQAA